MSPRFTILLPTTHDRGLLLPYSVGSVLKQTITDFELLIIGDGVNEYTRGVIHKLLEGDKRIKFFDFPKHIRRGEPNRHQVLTQEAKGNYVAYLLDRDLWLPNHLENLLYLFEKGNFVSSNYFRPFQNGSIRYGYSHASQHFVFSAVAHTYAFYRNLPYGWRTTPPDVFTDDYMWEQFMTHPDYKPYFSGVATLLYFKRGATYPGIPTHERVEELSNWESKLTNEVFLNAIQREALQALLDERAALQNDWIRIKGKTLDELIPFLKVKLTYTLYSLKRRLNYAMKGH